MASWSAIIALSGFQYSGVNKTMTFTSSPGRYFWSNGYAYGTCEVSTSSVKLEVLKGNLSLEALTLSGRANPVGSKIVLGEGENSVFKL